LRAEASLTQLLRQWGHTYAERVFSAREAWPTLEECDAVILGPPLSADSHGWPDPAGQEKAAPLVLLGDHPGSILLTRGAWRTVNSAGPDGVDLKFALAASLDEAARRRGCAPEQNAPDGFLDFLGHELRSPLTAVKTALEVLQGELGGLGEEPDAPLAGAPGSSGCGRDMLDIALRNIKRLHQTVDWSQDLMSLEAGLMSRGWETVPVDFLVEALADRHLVSLDPAAAEKTLETDPALPKVLLGQLVRVLEYTAPQGQLKVRIQPDPQQPRELVVALTAVQERGVPDPAQVNRTGLTRADGQGTAAEINLLLEYVVSRKVLEQLQGRVAVVTGPGRSPSLHLTLVGRPEENSADDRLLPLASLRAPA
jgi:signal transduction histidine kinase